MTDATLDGSGGVASRGAVGKGLPRTEVRALLSERGALFFAEIAKIRG